MNTLLFLQYSVIALLVFGVLAVYFLALREKIRKANGMDTPADQVPVPADFHEGRQLTHLGPVEGQKPWIETGLNVTSGLCDDDVKNTLI